MLGRISTPRRYAGVSAIAAAGLFGTGTALWAFKMPAPTASRAEIVDFYRDASGRIIAGGSLSLGAIAAFALFASSIRRVLAEAEGDDTLANTAFGGALLGLSAGLGAETINMAGAMRARDGTLTEELGQSLFHVSNVLGFNAAGVGLGVLAAAVAAVALRTGDVLPRWLALVTGLLGLGLLTPFSRSLLGPSVLLLPVIAAHLLRAPRRRSSAAARWSPKLGAR